MKIGTSKTQRKDQIKSGFLDDQIKLVDGSNVHRVISGPQGIKTFFYSTIKEQDGKLDSSWQAINFKEDGTLIDALITLEEKVRKGLGQKVHKVKGEDNADVIQLGFNPRKNWFYLAFDLMDKTDPRVRAVKYPKTVKDAIYKLETKADPMKTDVLLNGPFYCYNLLIDKVIEPGKSRRFGTSYETGIYGDNEFKSMIPVGYLTEEPSDVIEALGGMDVVFTEAMIQAIEECNLDLESELKPKTSAEIQKILEENPINIFGVRSNTKNDYLYPHEVPEFKEGIQALGLPVAELDPNTSAPVAPVKTSIQTSEPEVTEAPKHKGLSGIGKTSEPKEEEVEEAVVEEVAPAGKLKGLKSLKKLN